MRAETLDTRLQVRITPTMDAESRRVAEHLGLRRADVWRAAVAVGLRVLAADHAGTVLPNTDRHQAAEGVPA